MNKRVSLTPAPTWRLAGQGKQKHRSLSALWTQLITKDQLKVWYCQSMRSRSFLVSWRLWIMWLSPNLLFCLFSLRLCLLRLFGALKVWFGSFTCAIFLTAVLFKIYAFRKDGKRSPIASSWPSGSVFWIIFEETRSISWRFLWSRSYIWISKFDLQAPQLPLQPLSKSAINPLRPVDWKAVVLVYPRTNVLTDLLRLSYAPQSRNTNWTPSVNFLCSWLRHTQDY